MKRKTIILLLLLCLTALSRDVCAQHIWRRATLERVRTQLDAPAYADAYRRLIAEAEEGVQKGPWSVTYKKHTAPSGDPHDYASLSRYFWPDPAKPGGTPYIYKDGESNPELADYDRNPLGEMASAVNTLTLAWYFSGEERYAKRAAEVLRVWFIAPATRMNPNLDYAQFVPGQWGGKGRPSGLIDSYSFVAMLDAVKLLEGYKGYTKADRKAMRKWFADFARWWRTSPNGITESRQPNNHGTTYDMQLAAFLLFTGDEAGARQVVDSFPQKRIFPQIEPDGRQPLELKRTLAFHYSVYNLQFFLDMAAMGETLGIDLLHAASTDGRSILRAAGFLMPYLCKTAAEWPYRQISGWDGDRLFLRQQLARIVAGGALIPCGILPQDDRCRLIYGVTGGALEEIFLRAGRQLTLLESESLARKENQGAVTRCPRSLNADGTLELVDSEDWCSGFFPGSLWMMYRRTGEQRWMDAARRFTTPVEEAKDDTFSHDIGFKVWCSAGNAWQETGDAHYLDVIREAARSLASRFDPKVRLIRSWDFNRTKWQYPVIIDNLMNLELLFEATRLTGDSVYHRIADAHARKTLQHHFRPDHSSWHVVDYDTLTALPRLKQTHQGLADSSSWARGQGWGLYGYTMAYRYTRRPEYLRQALDIASYVMNHPRLPQDAVPVWDFNAPATDPRDASAAAIYASALCELATYGTPEENSRCLAWADRILAGLIGGYLAPEGTHHGFLLMHSVGGMPQHSEVDTPLNYADYYFLEALIRRKQLEAPLR
jgi:rhamnogalacturonyl hydrolase YesR